MKSLLSDFRDSLETYFEMKLQKYQDIAKVKSSTAGNSRQRQQYGWPHFLMGTCRPLKTHVVHEFQVKFSGQVWVRLPRAVHATARYKSMEDGG